VDFANLSKHKNSIVKLCFSTKVVEHVKEFYQQGGFIGDAQCTYFVD
jgi:hypothetical protein